MLDTYNKLIDRINDNFVTPHLQIQKFEEGFYEDMQNFETANEQFPFCWLVPLSVSHLENSVSEYSVRVYFIDILEKDNSNERDVLSDQLSISRDFVNWLRLNQDNGFNILNTPSATPVKSVLLDYTCGWYMDLTIEVETEMSDCTIPFTGITGTTVGCLPVNVFNSGSTYSVSVNSGDNLQLPNITITNSTGGTITIIPSVVDYSIPDVDWTDSNGLPQIAIYGQPIVCTPCNTPSVLLSVDDDDVVVGSTMSITATTSNFTATSYLFFVYDGNELTFLAEQASNVYNWTTNVIGALELYVIATDGVSEVADVIDITVNSNPAFISEWVTFYTKGASIEYISNDDQIQLPLISSGNYNFVVDWGDGNTDTITVWNQAETRHTYAVKGKYTVTITGTIEGWQFGNSNTYDGVKNDSGKIITILNWGTLTITTRSAFHTCVRLQSSAVDAPIIATNDLGATFMRCYVFNGYVGNWDVSGVQNFTYMFRECFAFNNAGINDMDNWDISSISPTGLLGMFQMGFSVNPIYTAFNQDLPSWDVSSITNFAGVFGNCGAFNGDITTWDVSNGTIFADMFKNNTSFNQDISGWNVSNGTNFAWMMANCKSFTHDLSSWVLSSATDTRVMFAVTLINFDMSGWDMGNVKFLGGGGNGGMLDTCLYFDQDLSAWKIENVTLADFFLRNTTLSTPNYDATLIGWEARLQSLYPSGVGYPNSPSFNMGLSKYTLASAAATARASLISTFGWSIIDGGGI